ncbi:MAG: hypothetical protein WCK08_15775 [Betaproteobacteria bacterium]
MLLWHALELMQSHAVAPQGQRLLEMLQEQRWRNGLNALAGAAEPSD